MSAMTRIRTRVAVVGAGAAGCAAALALRRAGCEVALIDRVAGPVTRFCGEFLSGEALAPLERLGVDVDRLGACVVRHSALYGCGGSQVRIDLPIPGRGVARRTLDGELLRLAGQRGAQVIEGVSVNRIERRPAGFFVAADNLEIEAQAVIGAWGRRSPLDRVLDREFLRRDSDWVGVKAHFQGPAPSSEVGLYLFPGGHCGFVNVDGGRGTLGVLARRSTLQAAGRPLDLIASARRSNTALDQRLAAAHLDIHSLLTIGQIPLTPKHSVRDGILLVGDAGGTTAPFLGLGVTNAIRSGEAAAGCLASSSDPAGAYALWRREAVDRGRRLGYAASAGLSSGWIGEAAVRCMSLAPGLMRGFYALSRTPEPA